MGGKVGRHEITAGSFSLHKSTFLEKKARTEYQTAMLSKQTLSKSGDRYLQLRCALKEVIHPESCLLANKEHGWLRVIVAVGGLKHTFKPVFCYFRIEVHLHWLWSSENLVSGLGAETVMLPSEVKPRMMLQWRTAKQSLNWECILGMYDSVLITRGHHPGKAISACTNNADMSIKALKSFIQKAYFFNN